MSKVKKRLMRKTLVFLVATPPKQTFGMIRTAQVFPWCFHILWYILHMSLDTTNRFHAHGPPRAYDTSDHHCNFPKNNSVSTARMKSSKDAAAQVAKRRAIPRLIAKAINLDFALSISLQTNKLPAQHTQSILYLPISNHIKPSFTHLFLHFYSLNC